MYLPYVVLILLVCVSFRTIESQQQQQQQQTNKKKTYETFSNVSQILDNLLRDYDIRLRPKFGAGTLNVSMEVKIVSFDSISEVNMDYTVTIDFNQYWRDERLIFGSDSDYLTLMSDFADRIWVPDTFFANDKYAYLHDVTERNKMIKIYGNGDIVYGMRFTTTLACMMDLHNYPLDSQNCTMEIESYGYTNSEVNICWRNSKKSVTGVEHVHLPQFKIADYKTSTYIEVVATGQYSRLSLSFLLQRNIGYFILQTYLPSILIVMLSWVSFWINHEATSARVSLGITTVLTMTTISTYVRSSLPRISYVKAIDIYLVTCFMFVFAALLEYAAVNYTYWSERAKKRKKISQIIHENLEDNLNEVNMIESENYNLDIDWNRISPLPWLYNKQSQQMISNLIVSKPRNTLNDRIEQNQACSHKPNTKQQLRKRNSLSKSNRFYRKHHKQHSIENHSTLNNHRSHHSSTRRGKFKLKSEKLRKILPIVKDINIIDKYSRTAFPTLFLLFNCCYWCFYYIQNAYVNQIDSNSA